MVKGSSTTSPRRADPVAVRCPACGQRQEAPPPPRCPLCNFDFGDTRVTDADATPYATAYAQGEPGWRLMCEWIWYAGSTRLKHLALMRCSAAARRFITVSLVMFAFALAALQGTQVGWHWTRNSVTAETTDSVRPAGRGWFHVASVPRPLPYDHALENATDLWWNPAQAVIAAVAGLLSALFLMLVVVSLLRGGAEFVHRKAFRGEQRMAAAVLYSSAWCVPAIIGALIASLRPVSFVGGMARWPWYPPQRGFVITAGVLAGFAAIMWWFWLIRLGGTAPPTTRGRVTAFLTLAPPVIVAAAAAAWWFGLDRLYGPLFERLDMSFR